MTAVGVIAQLCGVYGDSDFRFDRVYLYTTVVNNFMQARPGASQSGEMWGGGHSAKLLEAGTVFCRHKACRETILYCVHLSLVVLSMLLCRSLDCLQN